ncbi:hypothetical protein Zmor_001836 [Zophobas morio]|uniref:RNA-directed DNA polymerase n=1 Tax=Zophobas morio TaxID=2755281 RepID=A0AA38J3C6_9CUCU|nr:hypothetical protein Zmor_001836 [Zophobas morio]
MKDTNEDNLPLSQLRTQMTGQQSTDNQSSTVSQQSSSSQENLISQPNVPMQTLFTTSQVDQFSLFPNRNLTTNSVPLPHQANTSNSNRFNPTTTPSVREEVPLSILLKFISPYSGDRESLQSFIRNCQNAHDLASSVQRPILYAYICSQLRDKAELAVNNHNLTSWRQLKEFLINSYSDHKHYGHLLLELQSCKQFSKESIANYIQRLETCTTRLLQAARSMAEDNSEIKGRFATIEQIALQTFLIGVKPDISLILRSRGVTTLPDAYQVALHEEQTLLFMAENSSKSKPFCTVCHKSGHTSSNCFRNSKYSNNSSSFDKSNSRAKPELVNQVSSSSQNGSHNPNSNKFCNYCKKKGHLIHECRKRAYNNSKKSNISSQQSSSFPNSSQSNSGQIGNQANRNAPPSLIKNINATILNINETTAFIEIPADESRKRTLKLLLDGGANISLVKSNALDGETPFYTDETLKLNGINKNKNPVQSVGYSFLNLHFDRLQYEHKFHVLAHETNIPLDGLLGNDFLCNAKAIVDYGSNTLIFRNVRIPLQFRTNDIKSSETQEISQNPECENSQSYIIQPRTQTLIEFNVLNPEIKEGITPNVEIVDGVYLSHSITTVNANNKALSTILNTNDRLVQINKLDRTQEKFDQDNVFLIDCPRNDKAINIDISRNEILNKAIDTSHLNSEERKSVLKICHNKIVDPPRDQIPVILKEYHDNPSAGHPGYQRTLNKIKYKYKWKNMKDDIKRYVKQCDLCQRNKTERKVRRHPMEITTTSTLPFERIALDIVGPLPITETGKKYILTLQDDLTKYSLAFPIKNHEATTIANKLVNHFICKFGIPKQILTDRGQDFSSLLLKEVARLFSVLSKYKHPLIIPQTNGALERSHATLADYLKHYVSDKQTDWDQWLNFAMFSYNTSVHTSTKYTPHELVFGNKPELPSSALKLPNLNIPTIHMLTNLN